MKTPEIFDKVKEQYPHSKFKLLGAHHFELQGRPIGVIYCVSYTKAPDLKNTYLKRWFIVTGSSENSIVTSVVDTKYVKKKKKAKVRS